MMYYLIISVLFIYLLFIQLCYKYNKNIYKYTGNKKYANLINKSIEIDIPVPREPIKSNDQSLYIIVIIMHIYKLYLYYLDILKKSIL